MVAGITIERNAISIRMNVMLMTNRKTGTIPCRSWLVKSRDAARLPPTRASPPGIRPRVGGTSVSCRVASAWRDAASVPLPASGTWICARLARRYTVTRIGDPVSPLRRAACSNAVIASRTRGAWMSGALTTTTAGAGPPGNAVMMSS